MRKKLLIFCLLLLLQIPAPAQTTPAVFIHFGFNKWHLTAGTRATLDSLTDSLYSSDRIELHGHCDSVGSGSYNDQLSQKRVQAVLSYLLANGWEKKDIVVVTGHGENLPVHNNNSPEERSLNRRVEIKIIPGANNGTNNLVTKLADPTTIAGTNITLRNINFEGGKHRFLPESQPAMRELLLAMRTYPTLVIRIEGHICCQAGPEDGYDIQTATPDLSENRAKAIQDFLLVNGIAPERISYTGLGHAAPIYPFPEKSEAEALANRRVEIKIISK